MTKRRRRTAKQRLALLHAHNSVCHLCGGQIQAGEKWEVEHVIPLEIYGDDSGDENCRPAHAKCHKAKTVQDAADIAKAKRREIKHAGASAPKQKIKSRPFHRKERKPKPTLKPKELFR